jgi:thiamine pyrophosphokinase
MASRQALIFIGGDAPHAYALAYTLKDVDPEALIIAADSGWEYALAAGKTPHVLIGDMDSINPRHLSDARARDIDIIEHSPDKDHTDTELALQFAQSLKYDNIHVITGGGDRFDHVLAMVHSLVNIAEEATVTAHIGQSFVRIATPREATKLAVNVGDTVSLIPLGGNAKGVTTAGLKWNLTRSTLKSFESRGVSNVAISTTVTIYIRTGALAVITTPTESDTQ